MLEEDLDKAGIIKPHERNYALEKLDEAHEIVKSNWQIEKEQRIKPSLWWKKVAELQAQETQTTNDNQTDNANTPQLTNLSSDGKAWFIHPVAMIDYFTVLNVVTYHIYHDGKIEKHIPQRITSGFEKKYKYVYHDKDDNEHEVCIVDWHTTKKKKDGVTVSAPKRNDRNIIEYNDNVNENNTQKRVKYANGDIAEYGRHPTNGLIWRLYSALDEDIEIVRMPDEINYVSDNITIQYDFSNTQRRYTGPGPLAGFIGALAELGFKLQTTGSCFYEASCFPSAEHVNGKSVDTIYTYNVSKDQKIIDAMAKFHFNERFIGNLPYFYKLTNAENKDNLHNSHLHSGNFDFTQVKEIKK